MADAPFTHLRDILGLERPLASLVDAAARLSAVGTVCRNASGIPGVTASSFKDGRLTLSAPSGALAARLRQKTRSLSKALETAGYNVNSITVKVKARQQAVTAPERPRGLSRNTKDSFRKLYEELEAKGASQSLLDRIGRLANG